MTIKLETEDLEELKIRCTTTLCDRDLHCFLRRRKADQRKGGGPCRTCKKEPVDWARIAKRNPDDVQYTSDMLRLETIRAKFWKQPIPPKLIARARALGRDGLRARAGKLLALKLSEKPKGTPWDSRQTPFEGDVIYFAQHATASCCRRCVQEWHGVPDDRKMQPAEIEYLVELLMYYLERRIPGLRGSDRSTAVGAELSKNPRHRES